MTVALAARRDQAAVRRILESLPEWFGDPDAVDNYARDAADEGFESILALSGDQVVGVALVRRHFEESAELHLLAVHASARAGGIGRRLVEDAARRVASAGRRMLTVHTVGPSYEHAPYAQTRAFYRAVGFIALEEHDGLDWPGPTLILAMPL